MYLFASSHMSNLIPNPNKQLSTNAPPKPKLALTPLERKASTWLALLFAVRMLGLFLLTPVFAVAAATLIGGHDTVRIGLALGAYGLTQAIMQIPLGLASDKFGRRPIIIFGLILFVVGGVICALTDNVNWVIIGRSIQGFGAVSAAITAWIADSTRPEVRTRAMAMVGASIGLSFAISLVLSPVLVGQFGLSGLFWVISALGFVSLLIATFIVPSAPASSPSVSSGKLSDVLANRELLKLNFGVFCLHTMLMTLFVAVPIMLHDLGGLDSASLWKVYLPVILVSFVFMIFAVFYTETRKIHTKVLKASVLFLFITLVAMAFLSNSFWGVVITLGAFFVAFNILEALQPSMVSRITPQEYKGLALGFYNTAQSLGIFVGGAIGGLLLAQTGVFALLLITAALALIWRLTT